VLAVQPMTDDSTVGIELIDNPIGVFFDTGSEDYNLVKVRQLSEELLTERSD
jgi:hypothetical protein